MIERGYFTLIGHNMPIYISTQPDKQSAVRRAAKDLSDTLCSALDTDRPVLCLFSGGSAFSILESLHIWSSSVEMTMAVLDERYTHTPEESNYVQLTQKDVFQRLFAHGAAVIETSVKPDEAFTDFADRFEYSLRAWRTDNPNGLIIATQGMGPDGHTAGMMPFPEDPKKFDDLFEDETRWVKSYDATGKNPYPYRTTTTNTFLRQIDKSFCLITGEEKRAAYMRIFDKRGSGAETPARIMRDMKNVFIYTDIHPQE